MLQGICCYKMVNDNNSKVTKTLNVAFELFLDIELRVRASNKNEISDDDLLTLHSIFGATLERALNIFEKYPTLETYSTSNKTRMLIEVKGENDRCYRIFPRINYCPCLAFKHQVVATKTQITCKHVLAARIALILDKTVDHEVTQEQYHMLLNSMFEPQS